MSKNVKMYPERLRDALNRGVVFIGEFMVHGFNSLIRHIKF